MHLNYYKLHYNFCHSYSWLPIIRTLANSNLALTRTKVDFPPDFLVTFTVILPSVTRTLVYCNLPLTRSSFCFPSDHFYTILPSITRTMLKHVTSRVLKSETLNLFQNNRVNSSICPYYFVPPIQIQCPSLYTLLLNCIPSPSICLFPYFRLFASNSQSLEHQIIRTFFDFPWRFELSGVDWMINWKQQFNICL